MILCLGTTPAAQRVMLFRRLVVDAVNRATATADGAAGKSINVAKVLRALDEQPLALTLLGGDRGEYLRRVLREQGVPFEDVPVAARTRQCVTIIDQSSGTQTELVEETAPVSGEEFQRFFELAQQRIPSARAVVMSGTIAPGGARDLYRRCTDLARAVGAFSVVDAHGAPLAAALLARPDLVKPNVAELAASVGRELKEPAEVMAAMRQMHERGAARVVVTAGRHPTLAFDGQQFWRILNPPIVALNPIGSGDAFTAGLVWRLLRGDSLGEACRWAAAVGAANALTLMAGEIRRDEVDRLLPAVQLDRNAA